MAIHDELDIDYGVLRLKLGGGDNGHNGLKSMTKSMGPDYHRVRFGIGQAAGADAGRGLRAEGFLVARSARSWTTSWTGRRMRWSR